MDSVQIVGKTVYSLLCQDEQLELLHELTREVFGDHTVEAFDWRFSDVYGNPKHLACSTFPLHNLDGAVAGGIMACYDVTAQKQYEQQVEEQFLRLNEYSLEIEQSKYELEEANRRLESLAATDGLTGLLNHRAFQGALLRETKRAERDGKPFALILMDVDKFKQFNDEFGHPEGDVVLKCVAGILQECARGSDAVARYGGEEFVVVLPGAGADGAVASAERMRYALEKGDWPLRQVTASFGVSVWAPNITPAQLIAQADAALYQSKHAGRNCVTLAEASRIAA
jgi:diguanylate cyclase (GGDEF)-like protein